MTALLPGNQQPSAGSSAWPAPPRGSGSRLVALLVAGAGVLALLASSFYTVQPPEMAGVRRLGTVVSKQPVGPGPHMKVPFVNIVDTIQTSLSTFQLANLTVYTIDNQAVTVRVGLSYRVPEDAVLKLLYSVGRSGNVDIVENRRPILADRVLRVFSTQNTVGISDNCEQRSQGRSARTSGAPCRGALVFRNLLILLAARHRGARDMTWTA